MKLEIKDNCPLNNFNPCKKFDCNWFIQVRGTNPQTGEEQDEYGCAIAYLPLLMIENSQQTRQAGASIESFRNEMVKSNNETLKMLMTNEIIKKIGKDK
jgi:hypothetical protein